MKKIEKYFSVAEHLSVYLIIIDESLIYLRHEPTAYSTTGHPLKILLCVYIWFGKNP